MSTVIDVAIGLIFLYLLLALLVTTLQELGATLADSRAENLYAAIETMLDAGARKEGDVGVRDLAKRLYEHPLIKNLTQPVKAGKRPLRPPYIPSKTFALALLDVLHGTKTASEAVGVRELLEGAQTSIENITNNDELKRTLMLLVKGALEDANQVDAKAKAISASIETWFNDRMARVSGWYKRRALAWSLGLSLAATACFNADSLRVARELWHDSALRASAVSAATAYHGSHEAPQAPASETAANETAAKLGKLALEQAEGVKLSAFPIGWYWSTKNGLCPVEPSAAPESESDRTPAKKDAAAPQTVCPNPTRAWSLAFVGWLVTALAVSLGAGFWFDVLGKALQLRGTGAKVSAVTGTVEAKG